jgi:hypothetical protein
VGQIRDAALGMFANAEISRTELGFADEKVLALTLLSRTVSNVKGALLRQCIAERCENLGMSSVAGRHIPPWSRSGPFAASSARPGER